MHSLTLDCIQSVIIQCLSEVYLKLITSTKCDDKVTSAINVTLASGL